MRRVVMRGPVMRRVVMRGPVWSAARPSPPGPGRRRRASRAGAPGGRRTQSLVIGLVVLVSTAASTLATGLLVDANAPFDRAFASQHGAQVAVTASAPAPDLTATSGLPGVTAVAGPFQLATINSETAFPGVPGESPVQPLTVAGRATPGGPVDDVDLQSGHWPASVGQIVISTAVENNIGLSIGQRITLTGHRGLPTLTVTGIATSVTDTADAWVLPAQFSALPGIAVEQQMLYRFASAGTAVAINADVAEVRHALPPGSLLGQQSWLSVKLHDTGSIAPWVPFIVAFGLIGLVMSVLIVFNVVAGAVAAGTRRIGVLKSIGFTPAQVVGSYLIAIAVPAVAGAVAGVIGGNLLAVPLLRQTARVFGVGKLAVPWWVDLAVPLGMLALAGLAALATALRAGRMPAAQAIATGRAPRPAHGYPAHRMLGQARWLPRPVTIGLSTMFARPSRTAVTLAAICFGAIAVTFGAGLAVSLTRVANDLSQSSTVQVQVGLPGPPGQGQPAGTPSPAAQQRAVTSALNAQPGTWRYVSEGDDQISVVGATSLAHVQAFSGDAPWAGDTLISGSWYGPGSADVNTYFLTSMGKSVGDTFTMTGDGHSVTLRIAGEIFKPENGGSVIVTSLSAVRALDPSGLAPFQYDVGLRPGTSVQAYINTVSGRLGPDYFVGPPGNGRLFPVIIGLITVLTLLLVVVAGLGAANTVVLAVRERRHDMGVFKALGMTPRQTVVLVVTSAAATGLIAGIIAVPLGVALQRRVLPIMGNAAQTAVPSSALNAYRPWELVVLALAGLVIAAVAALAPASRAARAPATSALRAE
jgi:putative ABC transport system permease protein